ncbi:hypothetical protein RHOFW104R3_06665 [Rhodanobacter denitrificans]|nr:hypothetical protein RHOFW104R3_06665 [Rhodanobacter denitrificans]
MPGADNVARQAKYIQLRAQELARDTMKSCAATWLRRTKKIVLVLVGLMLLVALAGALFDWVFPQHYSAPQTRDSSPYGY